jgi:hypothetical protein
MCLHSKVNSSVIKTLLLENPKRHHHVYKSWWTQSAYFHTLKLCDNFSIIHIPLHESPFQEFPPKLYTYFSFTLTCYVCYQFNPCCQRTALDEMYKLMKQIFSIKNKLCMVQTFTFTCRKLNFCLSFLTLFNGHNSFLTAVQFS